MNDDLIFDNHVFRFKKIELPEYAANGLQNTLIKCNPILTPYLIVKSLVKSQ